MPYQDTDLERAITTTWPQQLTKLAALDLPWSRLGPAATTALLYHMPSLTSLQCCKLSAPTQTHQQQQPVRVAQLKDLRVERSDLATLAGLHLSPQCILDLGEYCLTVVEEGEEPVGEEEVEVGVQQLAAAAQTLRHSHFIGLDGCEGRLEAEASERMVRTLAAGLRGGSHRVDSLKFWDFTFQQSNSAALVELLQAAPLVDSLHFE